MLLADVECEMLKPPDSFSWPRMGADGWTKTKKASEKGFNDAGGGPAYALRKCDRGLREPFCFF
ncbi:hypothetical protein ABEO93_20330 [Bacillus atrophaeus]|uniref:hypothetical protein n=1 Tax=Bacillus atrophaeus TaxID=1452 RepID=UPI00077A7634|nr:hypothetical protein [Bacillus atrophaeus]KXZ13280.1 hypothetical protein AXI57_16120 [Bacillus atrophaeus]